MFSSSVFPPANKSRSHWCLTFTCSLDEMTMKSEELTALSVDHVAVFEIGPKEDFLHWHIYLYRRSGIRSYLIQQVFPSASYVDTVRRRGDFLSYISKDLKCGSFALGSPHLVEEVERFGLPSTDASLAQSIRRAVERGLSLEQILCEDSRLSNKVSFTQSVVKVAEAATYGLTSRENLKAHFIQTDDEDLLCELMTEMYGEGGVYHVECFDRPWDSYLNEPTVIFNPPPFGELRPIQQLTWIRRAPTKMKAYPNMKWAVFERAFYIDRRSVFQAFDPGKLEDPTFPVLTLFTSVEKYETAPGEVSFDKQWEDEVDRIKVKGLRTHFIPGCSAFSS